MKRKNFLGALLMLPLISFILPKRREKTIFTEEMLSKNNFGLYVIKHDGEITHKNIDWAATHAAKLVWCMGGSTHKGNRYGLCNFLTDGWCYNVGSKQELVRFLNNGEYRILTEDEVVFMMKNRRNKKQLFYET